jgi:hypothetical protein
MLLLRNHSKEKYMSQIGPRHVQQLMMRWGLLIGLLLSLLATGSASAAFKGCRGDPKVWLSNGVKLTMTASIAADASQVKMVTYTVHVPRGLKVEKIVYTGGALTDKERVVMVFDRTSGYQIKTRSELYWGMAPVTINVIWENVRRSLTASSSTGIVFLFP